MIVPSLPGFPGGDRGHSVLDTHLDWLLAVRQICSAAGWTGADLAGSSVGASLAAEMAALWPDKRAAAGADRALRPVRRGRPADRSLGAARRCGARADVRRPGDLEGAEGGARRRQLVEWPIEQTRATEAAARIFWPLGNTRLEKRLKLIKAPTLLLWGEEDRIMPRSYADAHRRPARRAETRSASSPAPAIWPNSTSPDEVAAAILSWVGMIPCRSIPVPQRVLDLIKELGRPPIHDLTPAEAREASAKSRAVLQPEPAGGGGGRGPDLPRPAGPIRAAALPRRRHRGGRGAALPAVPAWRRLGDRRPRQP